jgi:hypothetical protein
MPGDGRRVSFHRGLWLRICWNFTVGNQIVFFTASTDPRAFLISSASTPVHTSPHPPPFTLHPSRCRSTSTYGVVCTTCKPLGAAGRALHAGAAGRHFTSPSQTTVKVTCISVHTAGRGESETDGRRMSFQFCLDLDLDLGPCLVLNFFLKFHYAKKKISRHIKISAHVWSIKCGWN